MVPYCRGFYDGVCAYVNMVSDLHRIIVEISAVRLVWWSVDDEHDEPACCGDGTYVPHNATLTNETISPQGYYHSMPRSCSPKVPSNDRPACDDSLPTEDDVLRTGDGSPTGYFVSSVLRAYSQ